MTSLALLWLPILLSAVFVFVVSSIVHMVVPIHAGDYKKMPDEDVVRDAIRTAKVPPGQYMYPGCESMKDYGSEVLQQKFAEGPVGVMVVRPNGMPNMGKALLQWFVLCLLISTLVAHLTGFALPPGAAGGKVFHLAALLALLGYAFSSVNDSIWKGVSWTVTGKFVFDGVLYAAATGATFWWLWPAAA
ncbi:MAG: hypothetical protein KAI24_25870 [Planctomycetes bacterium]|nr:hypothetical protein [Planctomycetota bacterium]